MHACLTGPHSRSRGRGRCCILGQSGRETSIRWVRAPSVASPVLIIRRTLSELVWPGLIPNFCTKCQPQARWRWRCGRPNSRPLRPPACGKRKHDEAAVRLVPSRTRFRGQRCAAVSLNIIYSSTGARARARTDMYISYVAQECARIRRRYGSVQPLADVSVWNTMA